MSTPEAEAGWLALTPTGALQAFAQRQPDETAQTLQALLGTSQALTPPAWFAAAPAACGLFEQALARGWVERLPRPLAGPNVRLDDFVQHVIASLSGERRAVLASETGFCLGQAGLSQDDAEALSAAAADFSDFAQRQAQRGWPGAPESPPGAPLRHMAWCSKRAAE